MKSKNSTNIQQQIIKNILEIDVSEKKLGTQSNSGCGVCPKCDCDPWDHYTTRAAFAMGRVITPKVGCEPQSQVG